MLHKGGSIRGVRTGWGAIDLPGRPYAIAVMGNYGETDEISAEIEKIAALNPDQLVTDCLSCRIQFNQATSYTVRHPIEILKEAYDRY